MKDGTDTVLGCYQIKALLRALKEWSRTTFRDWFLQSFRDIVYDAKCY